MKEITLEARIENTPKVIAFIDEALDEWEAAVKARYQIDVAVDEIFANISRYAYAPRRGEAWIKLSFDAQTRMLTITFIDRGTPFDPLAKPDPDVTAAAKDREIGGLGIFLVKKTMDAVEYRRENDGNILVLQKRI